MQIKEETSENLEGDKCRNDVMDTFTIGHVNKLLHSHIDSYLKACKQAPMDYDNLRLDEHIESIDPQLCNAICCMTRSKSEIRGTSKVYDSTSPAYHVKKVRRFFLLCSISMIDVQCLCTP